MVNVMVMVMVMLHIVHDTGAARARETHLVLW
jgi:hypothetical protein